MKPTGHILGEALHGSLEELIVRGPETGEELEQARRRVLRTAKKQEPKKEEERRK